MTQTPDVSASLLANSYSQPNTAALASGHAKMSDAKATAVSKDFESMFLSQMLEQMYGDTEGDDSFGSSESSDIYKSMMMNEYGKKIEAAGGIGIASTIKRELLKTQEIQ